MNTIYEQAGIASFLAGMRRAREILDNEIGDMEGRLSTLQETVYRHKLARPKTMDAVEAEAEAQPEKKSTSRQHARWTPERRAEASKRMKKMRASGFLDPNKNRRKGSTKARGPSEHVPDTVSGQWTYHGLARKLGLTVNAVQLRLRHRQVKPLRTITMPNIPGNGKVSLFPKAVFKALEGPRVPAPGKAAKPASKPKAEKKTHWQTANHPRNADHPKHAQYIANLKAAMQKHSATKQQVNGVAVA